MSLFGRNYLETKSLPGPQTSTPPVSRTGPVFFLRAVIAARRLVGATAINRQLGTGSEQGAVRERTYGMALPRCTFSAGRAVYDERAATRPFLGAHPVQLELSVRATLCDQCIATVGSGGAAGHSRAFRGVGAECRSRTCDLRFRRPTLYPAELIPR